MSLKISCLIFSITLVFISNCFIDTSVTNATLIQMLKNVRIQFRLEEVTLACPMWVRFGAILKEAFLQPRSSFLLSAKLVVSDFLRSWLIIGIAIVSLTRDSPVLIG